MEPESVVVTFLRHDGTLYCRRRGADDADTSGTLTVPTASLADCDDVVATARSSGAEEIGLAPDALALVRTGRSLDVGESGRTLHPVLFDVSDPVGSGGERASDEWHPATELVHRETTPGLWEAYRRVAPSVRSITADDEHGAEWLSLRALEVLRDRAAVIATEADGDGEKNGDEEAGVDELLALADRLRTARPSMAVVRNRVLRVLGNRTDPADIEAAAIDGIDRAVAARNEVVDRATEQLDDASVLTLSWSGTVKEILTNGTVAHAFVAESRPAREGTELAETIADDVPTTVCTDAAVGHVLATESVDAVLVSADTVLLDGRVVNKAGTRTAALAAAHEDCHVYVAAASDKVTTSEAVPVEHDDASAVYDGPADLDVRNPLFDVTPTDAITAIITERGVYEPAGVGEIVAELRELERQVGWDDPEDSD